MSLPPGTAISPEGDHEEEAGSGRKVGLDSWTPTGLWGVRVEIPLRAKIGELWHEDQVRRGELLMESLESQGQGPGLLYSTGKKD